MRSELHDPLPARPSPAEQGHARMDSATRTLTQPDLADTPSAAPSAPDPTLPEAAPPSLAPIPRDGYIKHYEIIRALVKHRLLGTDHRWRVEHCGGCRGDQFARAASLGVMISLPPFQFIYWGDVLDGTMFPSEIGRQWVQAGGAMKTGAPVSFHNDGCVSPPIPLLNVQSMVTRRTPSGTLHGPEQAVILHDALLAHTMHAAHHLKRDNDLGSITVGKLADFVELSADPYAVPIDRLVDEVKVNGTWSNGKRVDLAAFMDQIAKYPPIGAKQQARVAALKRCC
ncbi:amidohydrolase family protein [Polyangium mundeleinium]|uniref:Amidohydrolase family protein n=1 Tax=Polyangium mundeleinium TaxID=2995306 RepID=A0ABT5F3F1_9BACT|nr:amidohydrolase family protein [Polyangium mundeleinium]MDC0748012.1 amidohydrolase family protein [Polyangium mundeleinium]